MSDNNSQTQFALSTNDDYDALARIAQHLFPDFAQGPKSFASMTRPHARTLPTTTLGCRARRPHRGVRRLPPEHRHCSTRTNSAVEIGVDRRLPAAGHRLGAVSDRRRRAAAVRADRRSSAWCREDMACYVRFLAHRGFVEDHAHVGVDPGPDHVRPGAFREIRRRWTRDRDHDAAPSWARPGPRRKLYDLWCEVARTSRCRRAIDAVMCLRGVVQLRGASVEAWTTATSWPWPTASTSA